MLCNLEESFLVVRITGFILALPMMIKAWKIQDLVGRITPRRMVRGGALDAERVRYLCDRVLGIFRITGYRHTCMRRCLLLYHFLRCYGVPVTINFGAKLEEGGLTGHSWLSLDGRIHLDTSEKVDQFTCFFSLPDGGSTGGGAGGSDLGRASGLEDISFD